MIPKTTLAHWASQNSLKRNHPASTACSAQFQKWKFPALSSEHAHLERTHLQWKLCLGARHLSASSPSWRSVLWPGACWHFPNIEAQSTSSEQKDTWTIQKKLQRCGKGFFRLRKLRIQRSDLLFEHFDRFDVIHFVHTAGEAFFSTLPCFKTLEFIIISHLFVCDDLHDGCPIWSLGFEPNTIWPGRWWWMMGDVGWWNDEWWVDDWWMDDGWMVGDVGWWNSPSPLWEGVVVGVVLEVCICIYVNVYVNVYACVYVYVYVVLVVLRSNYVVLRSNCSNYVIST